MIKQAVILCGGLGKRLMPLTKKLPKPMVKINSKPFLEYIINLLKDNGITEILILGGYKYEKITRYFKDGSKFGVNIKYSIGPIELDTGERVYNAKKELKPYFFLLYSDNLLSVNFNKIYENFSKKNDITFLLKKKKCGNFLIHNNKIKKYSLKRSKNNNFVELGFAIIKSKSLINFFKKNKKYSINDFYLNCFKRKSLSYSIHEDIYYSIGDKTRFLQTKKFLTKKKIIFLDRDGTINKSPGKSKYLVSEKNIIYEKKILKLLKDLSKKNFKFIIISNQAGISLNKLTLNKLNIINKKIINDLNSNGIKIIDLYFCPHHWNDECVCRKPKPGMFFSASEKHKINLSKTIYIGDDIRDMEACENSNCKGIFFNDSFDVKKNKNIKLQNLIIQSKNISLIKKEILKFYDQ